MNFLKTEFAQNLGLGFCIGALIVGLMSIEDWEDKVVSPAMAASTDIEIVNP